MPKSGYDQLMHIACVEWGFCGCVKNEELLHVSMLIPSYGPVTADQFVEWLFLADDQNPNSDAERWQYVKDALKSAFIECMGAEVVDASKLEWACVADAKRHSRFDGNTKDEN